MIISLFLTPIFAFIKTGVNLVNGNYVELPFWFSDFMSLLKIALMFFPVEVWVVAIANIVFWITAQYTWAILEWIYKKIPGIN